MPTAGRCGAASGITSQDPQLGQPLCWECYDYTGHVLWQWHAPELWRRFTIALQRRLAAVVGLSVKGFRERCRISYSKVVEFQARGLVHVHVPIRLDGPDGPDGEATDLPLTTRMLEDAIQSCGRGGAVAHRSRCGTAPSTSCAGAARSTAGRSPRMRTGRADASARVAHPEQVAAYLAKYLTKATEDFGLPAGSARRSTPAVRVPPRMRCGSSRPRSGSPARGSPMRGCATTSATLGYRGHPITKSRAYSVTFGQIRRARRAFRRNPGLDPDADVRRILDDDADVPEGFELVSSWVYVGRGYLDLDQAAAAVMSAAVSRTRW